MNGFLRILSRHTHHGAPGKEKLISIANRNKEERSGFADLLANLIEKYMAELDLDKLPESLHSLGDKKTVNNLVRSEDSVENWNQRFDVYGV